MRILETRQSLPRRLSLRSMLILGGIAVAVLPYGRAQEPVNLAPVTGDSTTHKSAPVSGPAEPVRPRVVRVAPANGATDVDTATEIRIRFDRPMDPNRLELNWGLGVAGFRLRGTERYDADTHEFVIPVWLTPRSRHNVKAGNKSRIHSGELRRLRIGRSRGRRAVLVVVHHGEAALDVRHPTPDPFCRPAHRFRGRPVDPRQSDVRPADGSE